MLTHLDEKGRPRMVDVGGKQDTERIAIARGSIQVSPEVLEKIQKGTIAKGDVLSVHKWQELWGRKEPAKIFRCAIRFLSQGWKWTSKSMKPDR